MSASPRTIVIGLDGVPPWLLEDFMNEGKMPHLAELRRRGVFGRMRSTINMMTASAWTTMTTGVEPSRHGLFNFVQYVVEKNDIHLPTAMDRKAAAIWDLIGDTGGASAVLRVPMTFPTLPMEGMMVADHLSPSVRHPQFVWPRDLRGELLRKFGLLGWLKKTQVRGVKSFQELQSLFHQWQQGVDLTFGLIDDALERGDHDLIFAVCSETDAALHRTFPVLADGGGTSEALTRFPDRARQHLRKMFSQIDERFADLTDTLDKNTNIVLVSDHGMGANDPGAQLVRPLLIKLGYQAWVEPPPAPTEGLSPLALLRRIKSAIASHIPWQIRRLILPLSHQRREQGARKHCAEVIKWDETTAFTVVPGGGCGEIWLNLRDRSPQGIVPPEEKTQLTGELVGVLKGALNTDTGTPQIETVQKREDYAAGDYAHRIPDLLVRFRTDQHCTSLEAKGPDGTTASVDRSSTGSWGIDHCAYHTPYGFFMAAGPDIKADSGQLSCEIADVMPTLAYLCKCPIPRGLDGRLLKEIIRPEVLSRRPPQETEPLEFTPESQWEGYTDEERADIEGRLADLGYL